LHFNIALNSRFPDRLCGQHHIENGIGRITAPRRQPQVEP
jgi:hypothetical protein